LAANSGILPWGYPERHIPEENQVWFFRSPQKLYSRMRTIGAGLFLLLIIPLGGGLHQAKPLSKTTFLAPGHRPHSAELNGLLHRATAVFEAGKYDEAAETYLRGFESATARGDKMAASFLWGIGNCHFARRRYQQAIESYLSARRQFELSGDSGKVSALNGGLASVYLRLGEYDAAIDAIQRGLTGTPALDPYGTRARHLISLASLSQRQGRFDESQKLFREAILEAYRFNDPDLLSSAWANLGAELLDRKQLPEAEDALLEAYRIRKLNRLPGLGESYRNLGILRLEQGDLRSASALMDAAVAESKSPRGRAPEWPFYESRGWLRLAQGKVQEAFADFRLALELARNYRLAVPASDATRVSLEGRLQKVYSSFVETGSRLYFETARADLARETFEAAEENRAESLEARLDERKQLRRKLPPAYWELLTQLESAQSAALLDDGEGPRQAMRRLRRSLLEMEVQAGGAGFTPRANLLERVQRLLDSDTVLLSFHLAQPASCLWAVSKSGFSLYRLPDRASIASQVREFRRVFPAGGPDAERLGRKLYRTLFGALGPGYGKKSRWLLSLDEGLFDLPFAALVEGRNGTSPVHLIERHSVRILSGAAMWAGRTSRENRTAGAFVGVGDAIYNIADTRWPGKLQAQPEPLLWSRLGWPWTASAAAPTTLGLSRLPGSGPEIDACARAWGGESVLLKGRDATKGNLRGSLAAGPSVIHLATHVLRGPERSTGALVALSVSENGQDELLGPAEIGGWNADAALVVLSGCSSGAAEARPGAGLMGLTRAWLMAGARAVVATEWPTPDDVGVFFRRFYLELQRSPTRDPAEALRAAQIEALRSQDWRSQPGFWAAYFAVGNY
jgi:CHAT domain-containing protein